MKNEAQIRERIEELEKEIAKKVDKDELDREWRLLMKEVVTLEWVLEKGESK